MKRIFLGMMMVLGLGVSGAALCGAQTPAQMTSAPVPLTPEAMVESPAEVTRADMPPQAVIPPQVPVLDWSYSGANAPAHWADLRPDYHACRSGTKQSPVNIAQFYQDDLPEMELRYGSVPLSLINTGQTVQVNIPAGNAFFADGMRYTLKQMVFHTPSEHYMDGAPYPMELQMLHRGDDGTQVILSVMLKIGPANRVIQGIWQNIPVQTFAEKTLASVMFSPKDVMPDTLDYYKYTGSLTTPPCNEGVTWFVMKDPITLSEDQLRAFQTLFPVNARSVQPLNGRVITGD